MQKVKDYSDNYGSFYPFSVTREISDIRIGLYTIKERNIQLSAVHDILSFNQQFLAKDIEGLQTSDSRDTFSQLNFIHGSGKFYAHPSAKISGVHINTEDGPVYIGENSMIMEGACIRGPVAILENSVVKMGAKIYGSTTIGKKCVVGGEIKNSVFFDHSNKAHDGYIGDSVIGSWCNLGAGTSCSNVKNNAGDIKLWNPVVGNNINAGRKCGIMMGDYTRTAINTSFNSGTVIGVGCNIVKSGFPPKYIPDFTWDVDTGTLYDLGKLIRDIERWMEMKNEKLQENDKRLLLQHYHNSLNVNR